MAGLDIAPIARAQDFSIIQQNEENKAAFDQVIIGQSQQRENNARAEEVNTTEESRWEQKREDAAEKGSNEYTGDGGRGRRRGGHAQPEDRVIVKGQPGGFDLKI